MIGTNTSMRAHRQPSPVFPDSPGCGIIKNGALCLVIITCAIMTACRSSRAPGEDGIGDNPANHPTNLRETKSMLSRYKNTSNSAKVVTAKPAHAELDPSISRNLFYADMESLCRAINRDYRDGTLADTFAGLSLRSPKGASILRQASRAMYPGRVLEQELAQVKADTGPTTPPMPNCEDLLDYIDDVE